MLHRILRRKQAVTADGTGREALAPWRLATVLPGLLGFGEEPVAPAVHPYLPRAPRVWAL